MSTISRWQLQHVDRSARLAAFALVLGACALAPGVEDHEIATGGGAPAARERDGTERIFLRARTGDAARARAVLREAEASFDLREVAAYESGCRLVERPRGVSISELQERLGDRIEVEPNHVHRVARSVNDPFYTPYQAATMEAIHAPEAWDFFPGQAPGGGVVVAVIDTGVDAENPDLAPSLVAHPVGAVAGALDLVGDTADRNGHGTASAGILAARGDDGTGIAGVAWGARLLPVKCFDDKGESDDDRLIRCYQYIRALKEKGLVDVRVANNGWGGLPSATCLLRAIAAAGDAGILSVFAAGNRAPGRDLDVEPEYPAAAGLPSSISVASAAVDGELSGESNFGASTVDLAAPGVDIVSLGLCSPDEPACGALVQVSGTSFATPFVSGAAALLFSQDPTRTPEEVKALLAANVTRYPGLDRRVKSGGMLNVAAALANAGPVTGVPAAVAGAAPEMPFADGTYAVDVAEFPRPAQKSPRIQPNAGYLFVRTVAGEQEQRWLLQGWDGHGFLRPPLHAMGMSVRPATLGYADAGGQRAVVSDLASWTAFARASFVSGGAAPSTYAKVSTRTEPYAGSLATPFDYPAYMDPPPPAKASVSQLESGLVTSLGVSDPIHDRATTLGFAYAVSDGNNQTREHWVLFGDAGSPGSALLVGSIGSALGADGFAGLMNLRAWQEGSKLVLGSVRYYPYVAE